MVWRKEMLYCHCSSTLLQIITLGRSKELNGTYQLLGCADDVNLLGHMTNIKSRSSITRYWGGWSGSKHREIFFYVSSPEYKTKILIEWQAINVAKFRYLVITVTSLAWIRAHWILGPETVAMKHKYKYKSRAITMLLFYNYNLQKERPIKFSCLKGSSSYKISRPVLSFTDDWFQRFALQPFWELKMWWYGRDGPQWHATQTLHITNISQAVLSGTETLLLIYAAVIL
jgi:hypothetical protein